MTKRRKQPPEDREGKVIAYARVSTEEQNIDMQTAALEKYGYDALFQEKRSARKSKKRPQFDLMLRRIRGGDTVVIWRLDRLSRDSLQLIDMMRRMRDQDIRLVSLTEAIDTDTPAGRLLYGIMALMAEFETDTTSMRTSAGMKRARERGVVMGRKSIIRGALADRVSADLHEGLSLRAIVDKHKEIKAPATVAKYRDGPDHAEWMATNDKPKPRKAKKKPARRKK